ncbi:MAG: transposase [Candidatus Pacebacteria bacterium]|nr:transposase [Candidatus Paceibacterota bacterium]
MTTEDCIIELFCRVDDSMKDVPKHPQAHLYPSELVTIGLLFAMKGVGERAFYRWLERDYRHLFPALPDRTRLFRLLATHRSWTDRFLAEPTVLGVADTYGIELIHPRREGRSENQIGRKGLSNKRWIVGCKLGFILNQRGLATAWDCDSANVSDISFQPLVRQFEERMVVFTDMGFHSKAGDPSNMKPCKKGEWNDRMVVETVLSMLTVVCHFKKVGHRVWRYFQARLGFTLAAYNIFVQWFGLEPNEHGYIPLSIAEFAL